MVKVLPFTGQTGGRGPGNGDLPDAAQAPATP